MPSPSNADPYEMVKQIIADLVRIGDDDHAGELETAMTAGSTGTEILADLHGVLGRLSKRGTVTRPELRRDIIEARRLINHILVRSGFMPY